MKAEFRHVLVERANEKRSSMTPAEAKAWERLKNLGFVAQYPYRWWILDFVNLNKRIVVEIDGGYHNTDEQKKKDANREKGLRLLGGFRVVRFWNDFVLKQYGDFCKRMTAELEKPVQQLIVKPKTNAEMPKRIWLNDEEFAMKDRADSERRLSAAETLLAKIKARGV